MNPAYASIQHSTFAIQHSTFPSHPLPIGFIAVQIAARAVTVSRAHQRWFLAEADIHHVGTTRIELAAWRETRDRREPALDRRGPPGSLRAVARQRPEATPRVCGGGVDGRV